MQCMCYALFVFSMLVFLWIITPLFVGGALVYCLLSHNSVALLFVALSLLWSTYMIAHPCCVRTSLPRTLLSHPSWYLWFHAEKPVPNKYANNVCLFVHPHGLLSIGSLALFHFVPNSNTVFAVSTFLFYIPITSIFLPHCGFVPATKYGIQCAMESDCNLLINPGGLPEIICAEAQTPLFFIERRFGIFKLAFRHKQTIQLIVIENEEKTYNVVPLPCRKYRIYIAWWTNFFLLIIPCFGGIACSHVPHRVHLKALQCDSIPHEEVHDFLALKARYTDMLPGN
jgi:hypothetical protein